MTFPKNRVNVSGSPDDRICDDLEKYETEPGRLYQRPGNSLCGHLDSNVSSERGGSGPGARATGCSAQCFNKTFL